MPATARRLPDAPARAFRDASGAVALYGMHYRNRALRARISAISTRLHGGARLGREVRSPPTTTVPGSPPPGRRTANPVAAPPPPRISANEHPAAARRGLHGLLVHTRSRPPPPWMGAAASRGKARPWWWPARRSGRRSIRGTTGASSTRRTSWRTGAALFPGLDHRLTRPGSDQEAGICLFRSDDPADPTRWRPGPRRLHRRLPGSLRTTAPKPRPCRTVGPFPGPVGAVVRHRGSGAWIAVFMAKAGDGFALVGLLLDQLPRPDHLGPAPPARRRRDPLRRSLHGDRTADRLSVAARSRTRRGAISTMSATPRS